MKEITGQDFDREVLECKLPVLTHFTADWCHSCDLTYFLADELVDMYSDRVKFVNINIEKSPEVSARYRVTTLPTIILFFDSQPIKRTVGFQDPKSLRHLLDFAAKKKKVDKIC